jgi:hypothetical protein
MERILIMVVLKCHHMLALRGSQAGAEEENTIHTSAWFLLNIRQKSKPTTPKALSTRNLNISETLHAHQLPVQEQPTVIELMQPHNHLRLMLCWLAQALHLATYRTHSLRPVFEVPPTWLEL